MTVDDYFFRESQIIREGRGRAPSRKALCREGSGEQKDNEGLKKIGKNPRKICQGFGNDGDIGITKKEKTGERTKKNTRRMRR